MKKRIFYHATWSGNIQSIKEKGIIPRGLENSNKIIDDILAEYGETRKTVPEYYWKYPLLRLQETAGEVYLSGDKNYAICNCLAGFEAETQLRSHLEARKKAKKFKYLTTEQALKKEMHCGVCEVEVNEEMISDLEEFKARAKGAVQQMPDKFLSEELALDYILGKVTIMLPKVTPEKIKDCQEIGRRENWKYECKNYD